MIQNLDSLERFLADADRPGWGWWARRTLWNLLVFMFVMNAILGGSMQGTFQKNVTGGRVAWALVGAFMLLLAAWHLNRWWFEQAIERWGFGFRCLLPALAINFALAYLLHQHAIWWSSGLFYQGVAGINLDYLRSQHLLDIHEAGNFAFMGIAATEGFLALFRMHNRWLQVREQALRARLAPHFLFNTLNTLHAQIESDPKGAQATTERLAALFRQVVEMAYEPFIPLKEELAFVERYLGIEQARLGNRLIVRIEVPEELENLPVPPLSLQVLVENAIKHGVASLEQGGAVVIGARRTKDFGEIFVEDPGSGLSGLKGTGTALETLRLRLEHPEDLTMARVDGGHRVTFRCRWA